MGGDEISLFFPDFGSRRLRVLARNYTAGSAEPLHRHEVPQLLHAARGVLRMTTPQGHWVVPPGRGVWIPALTPHEIRMVGPVSMRSLYIRSGIDLDQFEECAMVDVPPLLQQLLEPLAHLDPCGPEQEPRYKAIEDLVLLEVTELQRAYFHTQMPKDARLRRICDRVLAEPVGAWTLETLAGEVGLSARTLRRSFQQELGMSFATWHQQLCVLEAVARLSEGCAIKEVARDLGYASCSAFAAMFKRITGNSPREYTT